MGNPIPVHLELECRKATKILNDFVDPVNGLDKIIPLSVLQKAKGFAIFSVFRIGFLLSARAGSGIVVARAEDGRWSAPAAIGIGGLGGGFNVGAEVTDFLIVLNSKSAVRSFMATGSLQLGGNLSVAIGPLGRSAEASGSVNTKGRVAAMFSYSKSKGFYGGISVEGTVLVDREDANARAYGSYGKTAKQILSGSVDRPHWASGLIGTIERFTLANTPSKDLDGEYFNNDDTSSFDDFGLGRSTGRRASNDSMDSREIQALATGRRNGNSDGSFRDSKPARSSKLDNLPDRFDDLGVNDYDHDRDRDRDLYDPRKSDDDWDDRDRRKKDPDYDYDARNFGPSYAFGSPSSSISNTPARVGSASSQRKRPGIRQRSSSIASNLSFGSFGKKKLDRSGPTPPPDWNEIPGESKSSNAWGKRDTDGLDELDRELMAGAPKSPSASRKSPFNHSKSYSMAGGTSSRRESYNSGMASDGVRNRSGSLGYGGSGSSNTPVGWSQFSATDDAQDDLFGDGELERSSISSARERDPFDDIVSSTNYNGYANGGNSGGSSNGHRRTKSPWDDPVSGSPGVRGSAPPPSKSSVNARFGKFRTPSPGSSAFGRKKTPTSAEAEGYEDQHTSLIAPSTFDDEYTRTIDGHSSGRRRESFSLSTENAGVPVIERVVALFDFEAQEEGDLGFNKGQVIAVTKKTDSTDDWWEGRVEAGSSASKIGIFPRNYVKPL